MHTRQSIPLLSRNVFLLLVSSIFAWTGCDSNDGEDLKGGNDAELLVGIWNATSIEAGQIDILAIAAVDLTVTFEENGRVQIEATDETGDVSGITGTYVVDDDVKTITLDGDDLEDDIILPYNLIDENTLAVEIEGKDLGNIGLDLGQVGQLLGSLQIDVELTRDGS